MFKVGDRVKLCVKDHHYAHVRHNVIYQVVNLYENGMHIKEVGALKMCGQDSSGVGHRYPYEDFILVNTKPLSEVGYLDAFQNNFREGV